MRSQVHILLWLALLPLAACAGPTEADDGGDGDCTLMPLAFSDPITQAGAVRDVHDPALIKQGDRYYLFSTGEGIPIRRSDDLIHWAAAGQVFAALPPWVESKIAGVAFPWAPDVSYVNGRYHVYYSLSTFGSQRSVIGLATNATPDPASPEYAWMDEGPVIESRPGLDDHNAIDPNVAVDEAGVPWLAWGSFWGGIRLRRLEAETGLPAAADDSVYALAARPQETAIEAPFIVRRGGFYHLFVSFDACCRGAESTYKIMVGRSEAITGPYVDRAGRATTNGGGTLVLKGYGRIAGPGHNAVLTEGDRRYLVHHFYDAEEGGVPKLQVRSLLWDEDGWPLAGEPYDGTFPAVPGGAAPDVAGRWAHSVDFTPPFAVTLLEDGRLERCNGAGTWSLSDGVLTLRWAAAGASGPAQTEQVIVARDGAWYVGRRGDGAVVRGTRLTNE